MDTTHFVIDDESTYEQEGTHSNGAVDALPLRKKAQLSALSDHQLGRTLKPKQTAARLKGNLNLLPTMPLDIVFEILGYLAPGDLLTMSKTNKLFRGTLLSSQARSVWITSRKRAGGPGCPSDFTELHWASLIFGRNCQVCHNPNIRKIDFHIRRRVCPHCKKRNLVAKSRLRLHFPDADTSVLELLSSTHKNGTPWTSRTRASCHYYWKDDVDDMLRRLSFLKANIMKGLPDAKTSLEAFKAERIADVERILADVARLEKWEIDAHRQHMQDIQLAVNKRKQQIISKMIELGYSEDDLNGVKSHAECHKKTELTDRMWQHIRPRLEKLAEPVKEARLRRQYENLRIDRRNIVHGLYNEYKASLLPYQWKYLPRTIDICQFDCFAALIEADPDVAHMTEDAYGDCINRLPELLSARLEAMRVACGGKMFTGMSDSMTSSGQGDSAEILLNSVAAAFECHASCRTNVGIRSARILFGFDEIASHYCNDEQEGLQLTSANVQPVEWGANVEFNTKASSYAKLLAQCAGLDKHVSIAEMDAEGLRFMCAQCDELRFEDNSLYIVGFDWREAVYHVMTTHEFLRTVPWYILSPADTAKVIEKERGDQKWLHHSWTCGHCATHLHHQESKDSVVDHVRTFHEINDPQDPHDYFFFERYRRPFTNPSITILSAQEWASTQAQSCIPP